MDSDGTTPRSPTLYGIALATMVGADGDSRGQPVAMPRPVVTSRRRLGERSEAKSVGKAGAGLCFD